MHAFVTFALCLVAVASASYSYDHHMPIYQKSYIPTTVKLGESHHSYPVTEHRFSESRYETPGHTYAIPAMKTYSVTRPGYTTYLNSAITKTHITNHKVAGPTIVKPIYAPVVHKALVPISHGFESNYHNNDHY